MRGFIFLGGFALAVVLGLFIAPVLFVVVGLATIVWWYLTR